MRNRDAVAETREFLATAAATPFIAGVVGWVDLEAPPDEIESALADLPHCATLLDVGTGTADSTSATVEPSTTSRPVPAVEHLEPFFALAFVRHVLDGQRLHSGLVAHVGRHQNVGDRHPESLPDEKAESAVSFLKAAVAYYKSLGVTVTRVMTDNGSCYQSFAFRDACRDLGIKHIRTKPYTPRTNGKAERFIQTALREWV